MNTYEKGGLIRQAPSTMKSEPLKGKVWNGICPVPECNCHCQDEYNWLKTIDIKSAVEWLKKEVLKNYFIKNEKSKDIGAYIIKKIDEAFPGESK